MHHVPESSSPPVSTARAVLDAGKSSTKRIASGYSDRFLHWQNNIQGGLGEGLFGFGFALDILISLILRLMLQHKIYGDYESYKPLESHMKLVLMHAE